MKRIIGILMLFLILLSVCSCSNMEEPSVKSDLLQDFTIVNLADLGVFSRSDTTHLDKWVLSFEDREAYERTLAAVRKLDDSDKKLFFDNIGFNGAFTLLTSAKEDFNETFDEAEVVDSVAAVNLILECSYFSRKVFSISKHEIV